MAEWNDEYYERKEKEHIELVECWAYAVVIGIAICAGIAVGLGIVQIVHCLMGGA
ncbi:MAG: hypothetical protein MUP81_01735 [Dehalococcoidia bacterium]|nr:hypothetical protein [Dehalococcoidia bacterium]